MIWERDAILHNSEFGQATTLACRHGPVRVRWSKRSLRFVNDWPGLVPLHSHGANAYIMSLSLVLCSQILVDAGRLTPRQGQDEQT